MVGTQAQTHILVVDDDCSVCDALRATLEDGGHEVVCAADPADGARRLAQTAFDLLIADVSMPGNERLEWMQEVAVLHPDLSIVLVTGEPSLETAMAAVPLPISAYLVKPVAPDHLRSEVLRVLDRAARPRAALARRLAQLGDMLELSGRQRAVLGELVAGAANKEIASRLGCTVRTVEDHVGVLLRKAAVASRAALVARFWLGRD